MTFEAWLALLVSFNKRMIQADARWISHKTTALRLISCAMRSGAWQRTRWVVQALLAAAGAHAQPFVTDIDFQQARLPKETIRFLEEIMPASEYTTNKEYDCECSGGTGGG